MKFHVIFNDNPDPILLCRIARGGNFAGFFGGKLPVQHKIIKQALNLSI